MVLPRQLRVGAQETSEHPNRRRHVLSTISKGVKSARALQDIVPFLEPLLRQWVQEAVESSVDRILRYPHNQIECSGSRTLQLQFDSNTPLTMFTGSRILSGDGSPIRVVLYDSVSQEIVTTGPLSSLKVNIVVLDADFGDPEDWTKNDFDRKIVQNRVGKRPLVTGELMVTLQNGVGHIGNVSFTDNSSWIRSGKFKLGAKAHTSSEISIREGMSNSFKVLDHRGESYQKHYPPCLDDAVWRLEKIAKEGTSHKKLHQNGVLSVRDFLRLYVTNRNALRSMLHKVSPKKWERIIAHAETCRLDDKTYFYRGVLGTCLFFNTIYKVVGATFDEQSYHSVENLNIYQKRLVDDMKQIAYKNINDWIPVDDPSVTGFPMLLAAPTVEEFDNRNLVLQNNNFQEQDQLQIQINSGHPSISAPFNREMEQDSGSFEVGESSCDMQAFDFGITDSPGGTYIGEHTWAPGGNFAESQLTTDDIPVDQNFQVKSSLWQGNGSFLGSCNHHAIGMISSDSGIFIPRNGKLPRTSWCKVLAVVKWRILVRRNVAARKWKNLLNYF